MDFIIKLLKLKDSTTDEAYNLIIVIIDKLTKYVIIVPFKKSFNIKRLKHVLFNRLIRDYGIPKGIISDRDKLFTLNY